MDKPLARHYAARIDPEQLSIEGSSGLAEIQIRKQSDEIDALARERDLSCGELEVPATADALSQIKLQHQGKLWHTEPSLAFRIGSSANQIAPRSERLYAHKVSELRSGDHRQDSWAHRFA